MNMNKQKPLRTFQAGSVRASVWDNQVVLKDGSTASMPRVCVERRYKNGEGEWTSSNYFNVNELAKLQAVVRAAFDWLVMNRETSSFRQMPVLPSLQLQQRPQAILNGTETRSPTLMNSTSRPASITSPVISCPRISPEGAVVLPRTMC